jgi:hypothetical protein
MKTTFFINFNNNKKSVLTITDLSCLFQLKEEIYLKYEIDKSIDILVFYQGKILTDISILKNYATLTITIPILGGIPISELVGGPATVLRSVLNVIRNAYDITKNSIDSAYTKIHDTSVMMWDKIKYSKTVINFLKFMAFLQRMLPVLYLVLIILSFFGKPLEYIMLFVGLVCVCLIYVLYAIITLPPFIFIPMVIWFFIFDIVPLILYCIIFGALLLVIFLFCLVVSILNAMSGGALKSLVLCQNSPEAWYKTPNFHFTNKYERGLFCSKPCFPRYQPDTTGMNCTKLPKGYPAYCPQAEIMRLYTGIRNDNTYMYNDYPINGNIKFLTKSPLEREQLLKNHYLKKIDFMNTCSDKMSEYNNVSLSICSAIEIMANDKSNPLTKNIKKKDINKLINVCKQAYCNSKNNYPFCAQLGSPDEDDDSMIVKKVIKLAILIIIVILILVFSLNYLL